MAGYRVWTDDDFLDAAALNSYLMGQVVARFASNIERDAQLATPVPGQVCYIVGAGLQVYNGALGWVGLVCPAYSTIGRPSPASVQIGTAIWDTTLNQPLWSSGTAWIGITVSTMTGDLTFSTPGAGIRIKEGANAKAGIVTLIGGTATVATTVVTDVSRIHLTAQTLGTVTVPSALSVSARTAGTSFTILASQNTDTSAVAWLIVEPSP